MITSDEVRKCCEEQYETHTTVWKFIDQQEKVNELLNKIDSILNLDISFGEKGFKIHLLFKKYKLESELK